MSEIVDGATWPTKDGIYLIMIPVDVVEKDLAACLSCRRCPAICSGILARFSDFAVADLRI